ncbi:pyridoxamine 5'-phosphate oxidase [Aureobasidium sp. EXF-10727]|nr:pyridoxamine 5'-phosphate oxidase [Aureobasidium sp. EXF-10727]
MATRNSTAQALLRGLPSLKGPFRSLDLSTLASTPNEAFTDWLKDAIDNNVKEPHAMTLSTVDAQGYPDARVLILKNLDDRGWHFAIKADSPKGKQIANNAAVALTFYWPQLGRQIRIRGQAKQLSAEESVKDFLERPVGSKVTALASRQSEVLEHQEALSEGLRRAQEKVEADPNFVSPAWTVFAVAPNSVEFWQGATDRMHQRLRYEPSDASGQWKKQILYP